MSRGDTKYGHLISDDHDWEGEDDEPEETEPAIEVSSHVIRVDDKRDATGYEYGLEWWFLVEDGQVRYISLGHWLEGCTQSDPMTPPSWDEVPEIIKDQLAHELNADDVSQHVAPRLFEDGDST